MLEFLSALSLTGIPQPVGYLISQAASRFGTVRVGPLDHVSPNASPSEARSYIRSDDTTLIGLLDVDQALSSLGLRRSDTHRMVSRFDYEVVFWALSDARYPVAAETPEGELVSPRRRRVAHPVAPAPVVDHSDVIARLRQGEADASGGTDLAWIARQLDAAIRAKQTVTVTVQVPRSGPMEFVLEPTGVSGGRLRGRDKKADIERTLPLSSILELK